MDPSDIFTDSNFLQNFFKTGVRNEYSKSNEFNHLLPAFNSNTSYQKIIKKLLNQGKLPEEPLSTLQIKMLINNLAQLDANNWKNLIPSGEREGRVFSSLVKERNLNLAHGIGRSGNLTALQPKARGSSLILSLTRALIADAFVIAGFTKTAKNFKNIILMPCATGNSLMFCFLSLQKTRPKTAKKIIWSRIDQGSCYKSMSSCNFEVQVVELSETVFGSLVCKPIDIQNMIEKIGQDNILCVHITSSCFAPREPDNVIKISQICKNYEIPLIVNNAYGIQSNRSVGMIETAFNCKKSRIDYVVQSMDKNFLTPVGGSIILSNNEKNISNIAENYAGRASISSILDLLLTLLEMGKSGWVNLLQQRTQNFNYLKSMLLENRFLNKLEIYEIPRNNIQIAIKLKNQTDITQNIGAKLFSRGVTGCRYIFPDKNRIKFGLNNWGAHRNDINFESYLTVAVAIGMTKKEIDDFLDKLFKVLQD